MLAVGALAAVAVAVASGYGYAAVTATNNVYNACLKAGVINNVTIAPATPVVCVKPAVPISWSQTGPPGTNGTNGTNGKDGTNGTNGKDGVSVTSATEPAGANCADGGSNFTAAEDNVTYACNGPTGAQGPSGLPGVDRFTPTQIVDGAILTCVGTDTNQRSTECVAPKLNGMDIDGEVAATVRICDTVTNGKAGGFDVLTNGAVKFTWNGTSWALSSQSEFYLLNITCLHPGF
jgi:hypothetical protein